MRKITKLLLNIIGFIFYCSSIYSVLDFYYRLGGVRIGGNMARRKKYDYTPIPQRKTVKVKGYEN